MPRQYQDFSIPLSGVAAAAHAFAAATAIEPREPRFLGRLNVAANPGNFPSLLTVLQISGKPVLQAPGLASSTNILAGSAIAGFPGAALDPRALCDTQNVIGCAAGPNAKIELTVAYPTVPTMLRGSIGTDLIPPELLPPALDAMLAGRLWGEPEFALGMGQVTQANANTAETVTIAIRPERRVRLGRLVVVAYASGGALLSPGDVDLVSFTIRGNPMNSTAGNLDVELLSPFASDEDGLDVGEVVNSSDVISLSFACAAIGAAQSVILQAGFYTSPVAG